MPWKYKYEGKDKFGKKQFSKSYQKSKWVADYDNNCVRDYDKYIKESIKSGILTEADIPYISYFEGSYENACKFFNISGESCKIYDKEKSEYVIKEDSTDIKIERLSKVLEKHQTMPRYVKKSSAELFYVLTSKMNEQYYYVAAGNREEVALQVISNMYNNYVYQIDLSLINYLNLINDEDFEIKHIDSTLKKRAERLDRFLKKNKSIMSMMENISNSTS